jgi:hypothetical protein
MKSKFRFRAYLVFLAGVLLATWVVWFSVLLAKNIQMGPSWTSIPLLIVWIYTLTWLFWGECRTKMIKITIDGGIISVRRFAGLSKKSEFFISEFDGFKTSNQPYKGLGDSELLYLMKGGRKIIKISEYYHKNYYGLKAVIQSQAKNLGYENYSFIKELKEIFS